MSTAMPHALDRISRVNPGSQNAHTYYPVVVIGAGESGICMGARLQQVLGFDQFRIFERKSNLGGTWYTNTYPGIACDVPAFLYSYSFHRNSKWGAPYPSGPEILKYLYSVCDRFKLHDKIQCDTNVKVARWIESEEEWELIVEYLAPGIGDISTDERRALEKEKGVDNVVIRVETIRAKVVASACGALVEPKPNIDVPGIDKFEGPIVHTARWNPDIDFKGKDVTVVGTGCSSAQVVAGLVQPEYGVKSITQLLRSPPWVTPPIGKKEDWNKWMPFLFTYIPGFQEAFRKLGFTVLEYDFISHFPGTKRAQKGRQATAKQLLAYMRKRVPQKYHEIMTPNYEVFCKRRVIDDGWFRSLRDERVEITSQPLTGAGPKSITIGPGRHYPPMEQTESEASTEKREIPCDVLIMANGYATNEWLHPMEVVGKKGRSLAEVWKERGGAQAYLGTAMDGFPNFFLIFGPNTATGHSSVILASENMTNYALRFIQPVLKGEVRTWEVKEEAEREWTQQIQKELKVSVFGSGGARNWYSDQETGWNSTVYPRTQIDFSLRCMFPRWSHWNATYTRKGVFMLVFRAIWKTAMYVSTIAGAAYIYKYGGNTMVQKGQELLNIVRGIVVDGIKSTGIA